MNAALPTEIVEALGRAGLRARAARPITTLVSPLHQRAVYRVELVSGETIKARRVEDETTARALCDLRRDLPPAFAPVRACHGRVLLERWIEGEDLRGRAPSAALLDAAGEVLAALHAMTTAANRPVRATGSTQTWRAYGERQLGKFAERGMLDAAAGERIGAALARFDPGTAVLGLVHSDFCGENMVLDATGALHVIDNERVSVDALGYDLARTRTRWELNAADWERFAAAYAAHGGPQEAFAAPDFWRLVASIATAAARLTVDIATPETFAALRSWAAELP